jgi:hypothetical protein
MTTKTYPAEDGRRFTELLDAAALVLAVAALAMLVVTMLQRLYS